MPEDKKQRKAKFTDRELESLVDNVSIQYTVISAKFSDVLTNKHKIEAWRKVKESVNAVGTSARTVEEIRRKWDDLKSRTKKKASDHKKNIIGTGGGEPPADDLSEIEQKIIDLIGNTVVYGITGGIDTQAPVIITDDIASASTATESDIDDDTDVHSKVSSRPSTPVSLEGRAPPKRAHRSQVQADRTEYGAELLDLENEKVQLAKRRLDVEEKRLDIEEKRLKLEEEKVALISALMDRPQPNNSTLGYMTCL